MTTGLRRSSMRSSRGFKLSRQIILPATRSPNSLISAPATKVRPPPMNTTACTASFFSICATAAAMPDATAELSAFTGGLLMVTTATPSVFVSWTNSLIIPFRSTSYNRISGERDANFLRNSAKLFNDRHDQGHAVFTAHSLRFALGITGNKRTISARRGLRSTKCADEIVDLPLELIGLDETIDAHRTEKVSDSLPDTTRRNFLAQRKGWRKGTPISATQRTTKNIDHDGQAIAFVPSTLTIRTQGQKCAACDDVIRIGGAAALIV